MHIVHGYPQLFTKRKRSKKRKEPPTAGLFFSSNGNGNDHLKSGQLWSYKPGAPQAPGRYTLQIDAVDINGNVTTKSVPFRVVEGHTPHVIISTAEATTSYVDGSWSARIPFTITSPEPVVGVELWRTNPGGLHEERLFPDPTPTGEGKYLAEVPGNGTFLIVAKDDAGIYGGTVFDLSTTTWGAGFLTDPSTGYAMDNLQTTNALETNILSPILPQEGSMDTGVIALSDRIPRAIGGILELDNYISCYQVVSAAARAQIDAKRLADDYIAIPSTAPFKYGGPTLETYFASADDAGSLAGSPPLLSRWLLDRQDHAYFQPGAPLGFAAAPSPDGVYSTSTYLVTHLDLGRYHRLRQRFLPDTGGMCGVDWTSTKAYCAEPGGGGPGVPAFTFPQLNAQATIQALLVHHEVSYNTPLGQNVAVAFPGVDITYDSVEHAGDTMVEGWEGTAGASFPLPQSDQYKYAEIAGSEPLMLSLAPDLSGGADVKLRYHLDDDLLAGWKGKVRLIAQVRPDGPPLDITQSQDQSLLTVTGRIPAEMGRGVNVMVARRDNVPPGAIQDIQVAQMGHDFLNAVWSAPGDDGGDGRAFSYDIRYSNDESFLSNFELGTPLDTGPMEDPEGADDWGPGPPGLQDGISLIGLSSNTAYYIGVKTSDLAGNTSLSYSQGLRTAPWYPWPSAALVNGQAAARLEAEQLTWIEETAPAIALSISHAGLEGVSKVFAAGPHNAEFNPEAQLTLRYSAEALTESGVSQETLRIYHRMPEPGSIALPDGNVAQVPAGWYEELPNQYHDAENRTLFASIGIMSSTFIVAGLAPELALSSSRTVSGTPELTLVSRDRLLSLAEINPSEAGIAAAIAALAGQGLAPAGGIYRLSPEDQFFYPAGRLTFRIPSPADPAFDPESWRLRTLKDGAFIELPNQTLAPQAGIITGSISSGAVLALFGVRDGSAPVTELSLQGPGMDYHDALGRPFIAGSREVALTAVDIGNYVSGVDARFYLIDPSTGTLAQGLSKETATRFQTYSQAFPLPEGMRSLAYGSRDRAGNYELLRATTFLVDATPPVTPLSVQGPSAAGSTGELIVSSQTYLVLSATDPVSGGVNSGLMATFFLLNETIASCAWEGEPPHVSTAPVGSCLNPFYDSPFHIVAIGSNTLGYLSLDNVANREALQSLPVILDAAPPEVILTSPAREEVFVVGRDTVTISFAVDDAYDPAPVVEAALVHASGSSIPVVSGQSIDPGSLLDGFWELHASAVDFVQNSTIVVSGKFEVIRDNLPPRTSLVLGQPSVPGDPAWVKSATPLTLEAKDDAVAVGDERGLGVARTSYSVDSMVLGSSGTPFSLSGEGLHFIAYRSVDVLGHVEEVKVSTVGVDETPPTMAFIVPAANAILNTASPLIRIGYSDLGSGIDAAAFTLQLDGAPPATMPAGASEAAVSLSGIAQGPHTVIASIADRLGNTRSVSRSFFVDSIAPQAAMTKPLGTYVNSKRPIMEGIASDYGSGLNTSSITMRLDGSSVPAQVTGAGGGDGAPGPWLEAATLPTGLLAMASVVSDGMLYISGGFDAGPSGFSKAVRYASIGPGGVLGDWQAGQNLLQGVRGHKMVAADGNLIVLGGYVAETNSTTRDVLVARIDPANGSLGSWVKSNFELPFIYGEQNFAAAVVNGYLYVMGGENNPYGQVSSKVYFTKLCPQGGLCEGWTETTPLPGPLDQIVAVTVGDTLFLYVPGGAPTGSGGIRQVIYNKPDPVWTDGRLGAWQYTTEMPRAVTNYAAVGTEGHIYVLGGTPQHEPVKTVDFAAVKPDGTVGNWTEDPRYDLPKALSSFSAVAWDGRIFVVGGQKGPAEGWGMSDKVYSSLVRSDVPVVMATATYIPMADLAEGPHTVALSASDKAGNIGSTQAGFMIDTMPPTLTASAAGKALGVAEPWVNTARPLLLLEYTDAGSRVETAALAIALDGVDITASAQIGPDSASFTPPSDLSQGPHTLMASISDRAGNVASISVQFKVDSILPQVAISTPANGVYFTTSTVHMAASYGDGGSGLSTGTIQLSLNGVILPAQVDHSGGGAEQQGLPGPWSAAGTMPSGLLGMASAVWNGVLYVSGGTDGSGPGFRREVRYAAIGAGGVLGDWHDGPNLPQGVRGHRMVAVAGMLISMGGYVAETNQTTREVLVSRIQADGRPGDWQSQPDFMLPFFYGEQNFAATVLNGFLYVMGGENNPYGQVSSQVHFVRVCPQEPSGLCGAWTATTSLPGPLDQIVAVTVGNTLFLYVPGGSPTGSGGISQVLYNTPRTDGSGQLNEWLATTPMPRQVTNYAAVGAEGHIYVLGGTPLHEPVNTVDFAAVNPNGTVGNWTEDPQYYLPKPLMWASAVTWDGRIFLVGGQHGPADGWSISDKVYASLVRADAAIASATATYTATLPQDHYTLSAVTEDLAASSSTASVNFAVDWTPPDSSLVVDAASRSFAGRLYVQGQPPLSILALDAVSGVQERRLQVDGGDFGVIEGAFPLGQGNHELAFFSADKAGNVESTKTASIKLDAVAPAGVGDLLAVLPSTSSLTLTWTSPGDDGSQGMILSGELLIQYESSAVGFSTAQAQLVMPLAGVEPAATQSLTLAGLSQGTEYSVAVWTRDTAGNYSPISNTAAARTLSATQSADQLVSLFYPDTEVSVSSRPPAEVPGALSISIDQGLSMAATAFYELTSPSGEPITFSTPAVLRFLFDPALVDPELVAIYKYADLDGDGQWTWTSEPIANQARAPVAEPPGWWQITGEIYSASLFGVFQRRTDSVPPVTTAALGDLKFAAFGMWFAAPGTLVTLTVADADSDVRSTFYRIDSGQVQEYAAPFPLGQGTHRVEYWAEDRAGNIESPKSLRVGVSYLQAAAMTGSEGITGSGTSQAAGTLLSNGKVALSGNVRVVGDVTGSPVVRSGKASITGAISQAGAGAAPEPIDLALVEQIASATDLSALIPPAFLKNGALVLTGNNTLTLATGTYMLKGLNLSGNAMLEAAGPVSIFVDGAIQVSGNGKLNAGGNASRLVVFSKAASAVTLSGGAQVLGLVYAPKAPVELAGSARIGGSLYAKAVVFSGTARLAVGEALPPESVASGGGGGRTADADPGTVPGDSRIMAAADPAFVLRDLYAFPNPAVGGAKPVIHAAVGIADRVLVKIFDVSGRQTQEATLDGSPQIIDDGSGPKYAYEYTWDGHIPSGVYFYTIEAEKSGEKIRKAGKLSVVR